jgi:hypothetical protein
MKRLKTKLIVYKVTLQLDPSEYDVVTMTWVAFADNVPPWTSNV